MALSKIDLANMVENQMPQSLIADNINFRNIIINGDMSIAQRGTSATGLTNGSGGYHTVDRFSFQESGSPSFQFTQSQSTEVPTGQGFAKSLKMDCTTAQGSLASGDILTIRTQIEGQNLQYLKKGTANAESTTLSFWVRASKTGTYICQLLDSDNSRSISKSYTISSADTWEKKTITYAGDTSGVLDNDNDDSLRLKFWLAAGSGSSSGTLQTSWGATTTADTAVGQVNLADSTSNEWYVTGIQLEAGTTASDFEFLPHDVNLQRCQRYYQTIDTGIGHETNVSNVAMLQNGLPTEMRSVPSITILNTTANIGTFGANNDASSPSITDNKSCTKIFCLQYNHGVAFSGSSGENQILVYNDTSSGTVTKWFALSSEL